jgi:hypothetical protein
VDTGPLILLILVFTLVTLVGLGIRSRLLARYGRSERETSPYVALWIACDHYRQQVAKHVAWRLDGRPGDGPVVRSSRDFDVLGLALALQSPGPLAQAAGSLTQQTELLGTRFVRDDADPWVPDLEEWEAMLAEWQTRARDYAQLAHVDRGDSTAGASGDSAHRHAWSRTYTIRRRRTGGWLLEYAGNPSEIVVLPDGTFSAHGNVFRECEGCGTWESRNGPRGSWKTDPYSSDAASPRLQILAQHPG